MKPSAHDNFDALPKAQMQQINLLCNEFEAAWRQGAGPTVEDVLHAVAAGLRPAALRELLPLELEYRRRHQQPISFAECAARFPDVDRAWLARLFEPAARGAVTSADGALPAVPEKLGDYQLLGRLGSGGMGVVFKALHVRMGRTVALKILRPELQHNPVWRQRFDREVRAAARLQHANLVAALDAREQDNLLFLVTEFVDGADLADLVRRRGPLPVAAAVDAVIQAARGLDFAHRQGIVHRDVKPANLLRDRQGVVKVLDMGLARLDADDPAGSALTRPGVLLGTAAFMAPEQARDTRQADARSDIYSLGCTLYFLLTGRPIHDGATALDIVLAHINQPIPALPASIPAALDAVYRRMTAKDPANRLQTGQDVIEALAALDLGAALASAESMAVDATTELTPGRADRRDVPRAQRSTRRRWLLAGGAGMLAGAAGFFFYRNQTGDQTFALEFNGSSSYAVVPTLEPLAGASYTLEATVRPYSRRTSNVLSWLGPDWMAIYLSGDGRWGLARLFREAPLLIAAAVPTDLETSVHVAGVFHGSDLRLFIDGRRAAVQSAEFGLSETRGGLHIGGVPRGLLPHERFFHGSIHGVRLSRGLRYTADFPRPSRLSADADTIALFPCDEGHGDATYSVGPSRRTATIIDAAWRRAGA